MNAMNASIFLAQLSPPGGFRNAEGFSHLNLISFLGLGVMILLAWSMSARRRDVPWGMVVRGVVLQLVVGLVLFQSQTWTFEGRFPNGLLFFGMDQFFGAIKTWADEGARFVFGVNAWPSDPESYGEHPLLFLRTFAFGVIPTVIFFGALMSVLYYLGIMQRVVESIAWVMQRTLRTTGPESLAAAANVFVGHTEAPLVIRPYVGTMSRSELAALMVGGFATITGGLMAVYASFGISPGHLVVASIISAPAALVIAKILEPPPAGELERSLAAVRAGKSEATNIIDAAATGTTDGVKLAINIVGMLIAFIALIAMCNSMLAGIGELLQWGLNQTVYSADAPVDLDWSLSGLFGLLFWPLAWIMGIESRECWLSGNLLGTKIVVNEFLAYSQMGDLLREQAAAGSEGVLLGPRSQLILTYALCGFSNFGAIGIQLGGIGSLAPDRRGDLAQLGLRAMLGGMLACCMTACIAGMLYGVIG